MLCLERWEANLTSKHIQFAFYFERGKQEAFNRGNINPLLLQDASEYSHGKFCHSCNDSFWSIYNAILLLDFEELANLEEVEVARFQKTLGYLRWIY